MSTLLPLADLAIRPIREVDVPAVRGLHVRSFAELAQSHHTAVQIQAHSDLIASRDYAGELLSNNLLVAEAPSGRIVGTAGWRVHDAAPGTARIRKVFIAPEVAGRGLGRRLVNEAEAHAQGLGFNRFFVRANVNAAPFYARLGYRTLERGSMAAAGVELPVIYMEKDAQPVRASS